MCVPTTILHSIGCYVSTTVTSAIGICHDWAACFLVILVAVPTLIGVRAIQPCPSSAHSQAAQHSTVLLSVLSPRLGSITQQHAECKWLRHSLPRQRAPEICSQVLLCVLEPISAHSLDPSPQS